MSISLEQVSKHYDGAPAISDVSVEIADGELFVLLGPSGSGKSTLLRAIAGLTTIDRGRIVLHGRDVTHTSAREREVGFVFQNYALFRHMSVAENIEFALRARGVPAEERRERRKELLELVSLQGLGKRLPSELSGGQQQRVAVARALAHEPRVLLLDEPFGALDAKIRDELRRAIRDIQRAVGITTILVTHDQEEAFTMADRIGVMDRGRLQETDEPRALYTRPRTRFVATFLGATNLLLGRQEPDGMRVGNSVFETTSGIGPGRRGEATVVIRPEDVVIARSDEPAPQGDLGHGIVRQLEFVGVLERVRVEVDGSGPLTSAVSPGTTFTLDASRSARDAESTPLEIGQRVRIGAKRVHVLPTPISSLRLLGRTEPELDRLATSRLISELGARMQIAPVRHLAADGVPAAALAGLAVVAFDRSAGLYGVAGLLDEGARQVLAVADGDRRVERLVIYIQPTRAARDAALAAAGTLLRHLAVEGTLLVPAAERTVRGTSYRDLLDIRHAALRAHGVDVRTETFYGRPAEAIGRRLDPDVPTMLLLGVSSTSSCRSLIDELSSSFTERPPAATLVVRGNADADSDSDTIAYLRRPASALG
ncbi:MAG TPA: ABC transporter ATP-binding protein [Gammaproteobacteria bacterium]